MAKRQTTHERVAAEPAGRRQFLVHINADLIQRVKILAIQQQVTASSLVQDAIVELLARSDAARAQK